MRCLNDYLRLHCKGIVIAFILGEAHAGPPVSLEVEPSLLRQGIGGEVLFSAVPSLPGMTISAIDLVVVDEQDSQVKELGPLTDDGAFGDRHQGDGVYSTRLLVTERDLPMRVRAVVSVRNFSKPVYSTTVVLKME